MMNALRMRMETRNSKRKTEKTYKRLVKSEVKFLLDECAAQARLGNYTYKGERLYATINLRASVAAKLRNKGYKVEMTNLAQAKQGRQYVISSISWTK